MKSVFILVLAVVGMFAARTSAALADNNNNNNDNEYVRGDYKEASRMSTIAPSSVGELDRSTYFSAGSMITYGNSFSISGIVGKGVGTENAVQGTSMCTPYIYPGGYYFTAAVPINTGLVPGFRATEEMYLTAADVPGPHMSSFTETAHIDPPRKNLISQVPEPMFVYAGYGGVACVYYYGDKPIPVTMYVTLSPSAYGIAIYAVYAGLLATVTGVLLARLFTSSDAYQEEPKELTLTGLIRATDYFPGLDIPMRYQRTAALAAFLAGAMVSTIPTTENHFNTYSSVQWPLEWDKNDSLLHPYFMPLSVWPTLIAIPLAVLAQFFFGLVCAYTVRLRWWFRYDHALPNFINWLVLCGLATLTIYCMPSGYDYRMQALVSRKFIVFCSQMTIWVFMVRPLLGKYKVMSAPPVDSAAMSYGTL